MKKLEITTISIKDLIPYINNPKDHPEGQITRLVSSIKEFGFINPVVIDNDNVVVAGHGRLEAAKRLNMEAVPTIQVGHLTPAQIKAFRIADNKVAESGWIDDILRVEIESLQEMDFDIELTGFCLEDFEPNDIDYEKEWEGMPEFENEDKTAFMTIHIHFATQAHVDEFSKMIGQKLTEKTKFIWHPKLERENLKQYEIVDES